MKREAWEERMVRQGVERYRAKAAKYAHDGVRTLDPVVQSIFSFALTTFIQGLEEHLANVALRENHTGGWTERYIATAMLRGAVDVIGVERVAAISGRCVMDSISQRSMAGAMARRVAWRLQRECMVQIMKDHSPQWYEVYKHRFHCSSHVESKAAMKRTETDIRAWLGKHGQEIDLRDWSEAERTAVGTALIEIFCESTKLAEVVLIKDRVGHRVGHVLPTPTLGEWVHSWQQSYELLRPAFRAALEPPQDWGPGDAGGFISKNLHLSVVKNASEEHVERLEAAEMPDVYGGINALQRTGWRVNRRIYEVMSSWWESGSCEVLPKHDPEPLPERPQGDDVTREQMAEFRQGVAEAHRVNNAMRSRRVRMAATLAAAKELLDADAFYFVHQLDARSRCYPIAAGGLDPQGTPTAKALLEFDVGKPLENEDQVKEFMRRGAALADIGLATVAEQLQWVRRMTPEIREWARDPFERRGWMDHGDEQWLLLAWAMEWDDYLKNRGAKLRHCTTVDATQSGMQILSLLGRDPVGAAQVNAVPADRPVDMYLSVLDRLPEYIAKGQASPDLVERNKASVWARVPMDRSWVKNSVMTRLYNATKYAHTIEVAGKLEHEGGVNLELRNIYPTARWMVDQIHAAADEVSGGAMSLLRWLNRLAKATIVPGASLHWTTPLGFPALQRYEKSRWATIKTLVNGRIVRRNFHASSDETRLTKMRTGFAPNFIQSIDASIMLRTAHRAALSHFSSAHDCFGTHAADMPALKMAIGETYTSLFSENLLGALHREMADQAPLDAKLPAPFSLGDLDVTLFAQSQYAFS